MMEDSTKTDVGANRDGDVRRTHQQRQMDAVDVVPQSQGPPSLQSQQWCDSSLENSASSFCVRMMMAMMEQQMKLQQQLADQQQQFAAKQQEDFFAWCLSSGVLTGGSETLPVEPASCDNLVPEEGDEKLRYECERLLGTQYVNGTIDPCSPEVNAAQLGMDCSCSEPFKIQRRRQEEEEDMVSQQLERSQVELNEVPRRLQGTACINTMITEEAGSRSSLRYEFRGQEASREEEQEALNATGDLNSRREFNVKCSLVAEWKFAEQYGSKEVVAVVGQDPVMWLERDVYRHMGAGRRVKIGKLFRSHRPRMRPRTRWKLGAQADRSVNHRRPSWVQYETSQFDLLVALSDSTRTSRVRRIVSRV